MARAGLVAGEVVFPYIGWPRRRRIPDEPSARRALGRESTPPYWISAPS
jgi:hypothetical protein